MYTNLKLLNGVDCKTFVCVCVDTIQHAAYKTFTPIYSMHYILQNILMQKKNVKKKKCVCVLKVTR